MTQPVRKWVYAGYDGHGSISGIVYAKANNIPPTNVVVKFPDTSPENIPKLLYTMNHYQDEIALIDILINIKSPKDWLSTMHVVSSNNKLVMFDHHESNLAYIQQLKDTNISLFQFSDTVSMGRAISGDYDTLFNFALIGTTTDRDSAIKKVVNERELEEYIRIANRYDVLIRQNLQVVVTQLLNTPILELISKVKEMVNNVEYPPEKLISQVQLLKKYYNTHVIKLPSPQVIGGWVWKVLDQYAMVNGLDYVVGIGSVLDRQINQYVPVTFIIKYWLSDAPSPLQLLRDIISNRKVIGHSDGFSISGISGNDIESLALQLAEHLTNPSNVVSLLPANNITTAIANDYRQILQRLTEILEEQKKMYSEYLQLKKEQVELLKQSDTENKRRYD